MREERVSREAMALTTLAGFELERQRASATGTARECNSAQLIDCDNAVCAD